MRLVWVVALLSLPACSPGLGEVCFKDSDCKAGLRCTARGDGRGVCTYPEGIADLSVTKPDRGTDSTTADMDAAPDLPGELGPDLPGDLAPDQAPDQTTPDQMTPDQMLPDQGQPDQASADAAKPDS
jgi:hypothetical protein